MLIVISNQGGVSKGEYSMEDVEQLHEHLRSMLEKEGCSWMRSILSTPPHGGGMPLPQTPAPDDRKSPGKVWH